MSEDNNVGGPKKIKMTEVMTLCVDENNDIHVLAAPGIADYPGEMIELLIAAMQSVMCIHQDQFKKVERSPIVKPTFIGPDGLKVL